MTDLIFIKTGADWVDTTSYVNTFKFEDKGKASLNKLSVEFRNDIVSSDENPEFDKEIRWEFDGTVIFGGKINKPKSNFPIIGIEAYSYGEQLLDLYENNVYENQSPEAIATTIIETDTDLTVASSAVSNVTIDKIPFRDKRKAACVSILISDLLNWTFRTDYLKNAYIEEPGSTNSNLTLTYGDNLLVKPKWDYNTDNVVNKVIVEGDIQNFNTTGTYLGTGTYQTISLSFIPSGSVKVESPVGTEINPIVEGSSTGSYRLDVENKNITGSFASGNVQVSYSYSIPIRINLPAESGYSKREGKIKSKTIKSYSEARKIGKQYLSVYGLPQKSTTATLFGFHKDLISGRLIRVIDSTELTASATGIDEDFVMNKITYNYPNKICNITVGPLQVELFDWQKRVDEAIRELQQDETNQQIEQIYRTWTDTLNLAFTDNLFNYNRSVNDSWYWDVSEFDNNEHFDDRRDGDDFVNYTSGSYKLTDFWDVTGTTTYASSHLKLGDADTALYKGRAGDSGAFDIATGKVVLDYDRDSADSCQLFFRRDGTGTYGMIDLDFTNDSIFYKRKDVATGTAENTIDSGSYSFGTGAQTINLRFTSTTVEVYANAKTIDTTETTHIATGDIMLRSTGGTSKIKRIQILRGV